MTETTRPDNRRRFLSIPEPRFQKEFLILILFVALSTSLIMMIGTWFMMQKVSTLAASANGGLGGAMEEAINGEATNVWLLMAGVTLVNCICLTIFAFTFSKRASGIVRRVTNDLNRKANGEAVASITAREEDFFPDLVKAANRIIELK